MEPKTKSLSTDALIFGLGYLRGPNSKLSFGGDGATMMITQRARAALNELLATGYAEVTVADDQIVEREHYRGTMLEPHLGLLAKESGLVPFDLVHKWTTFEKIPEADLLPAP